jgi:hypothetical protein
MSLSDEFEKYIVWLKGHEIPNYDASVWRRDDNGDAIRYADYGDRNSPYGWEIDHVVASALGGSDLISNKRPLHHRANASDGGLLGNVLARNSGKKAG